MSTKSNKHQVLETSWYDLRAFLDAIFVSTKSNKRQVLETSWYDLRAFRGFSGCDFCVYEIKLRSSIGDVLGRSSSFPGMNFENMLTWSLLKLISPKFTKIVAKSKSGAVWARLGSRLGQSRYVLGASGNVLGRFWVVLETFGSL